MIASVPAVLSAATEIGMSAIIASEHLNQHFTYVYFMISSSAFGDFCNPLNRFRFRTMTFVGRSAFCLLLRLMRIPGFTYANDFAFWGNAAARIQAIFGIDVLTRVLLLRDWALVYNPTMYRDVMSCPQWLFDDTDPLVAYNHPEKLLILTVYSRSC
ncbi:hypothetical protein CAPTEDRAFT_201088 [Capitella teleta]|uniref:Uncharacterized protein n=1 Tax=Capitella teleta TaxID=283909 RepID=R7UM00_CAPTE|nr:hypothetical protein CAPTEDRAFT_201088 [Capitella teleta]|eukprot:ELU04307.1 hypothetical protein CAPTEDRAFT_201088 [Capitella teleta]